MRTGFQFVDENKPLKFIPAARVFWAAPVINTSLYNYQQEIWSTIPETDIAIKLCVFIPIVLIGIVGNGILLEIIFSNRNLRTPSHLLIANLVVADLLTLLICPVFFVSHDFFQNYVLGPVGCKLEGLIEGGLLITSVLGMCVISYDRLSAVVLSAGTRIKGRGTIAAIVFCWLAGFAMAFPLSIYRYFKIRNWLNYIEFYCLEDRSVLPTYWKFLLILLVWLPLGLMLIAYSLILLKLDHYERNALKRQHPMVVRYKSRVAKTLYIVLLGFIVVRVPFTVMVFIFYNSIDEHNRFHIKDDYIIIWWITKVCFIFLNAAINPLIYGLTNKTFKKALHTSCILRTVCHMRPSDEEDSPQELSKKRYRPFFWNRKSEQTSQEERIVERPFSPRHRTFRASWLNSTFKKKHRPQESTENEKM